jgi:hypothetical protein
MVQIDAHDIGNKLVISIIYDYGVGKKKTMMTQHIFEKTPFNFIWNKFGTRIYFDRNGP